MSGTSSTVVVAPVPTLPPASLRQRLLDYAKQPGTQQGWSLLCGGIALCWLHPFPAAEGIGAVIITAALPKMLPDNSTDALKQRDMANAIAHAAVERTPEAIGDAAALAVADLASASKG